MIHCRAGTYTADGTAEEVAHRFERSDFRPKVWGPLGDGIPKTMVSTRLIPTKSLDLCGGPEAQMLNGLAASLPGEVLCFQDKQSQTRGRIHPRIYLPTP